jgi:hypothetical protein
MRAAGMPPMNTVAEPITIMSGGPTQKRRSDTRAAGSPPIKTVGMPGGRIGPPTWGTRTLIIGQICKSVIRAANGISTLRHFYGQIAEILSAESRFSSHAMLDEVSASKPWVDRWLRHSAKVGREIGYTGRQRPELYSNSESGLIP